MLGHVYGAEAESVPLAFYCGTALRTSTRRVFEWKAQVVLSISSIVGGVSDIAKIHVRMHGHQTWDSCRSCQ